MALIKLTQGQSALVDDEDLEYLSQFRWHYHCGYAYRAVLDLVSRKMRRIAMHNDLLKTRNGFVCDHINGDTLDNRRCNIREATIAQNNMNKGNQKNNTSGYKGVSWHKYHNSWKSYITLDKKRIHLGSYQCPKEAAQAYNEAAIKYHGDFAKLNNIEPQTSRVA